MGLSKQGKKYWKGGDKFGTCVSQLYSEEFFLKVWPFQRFFAAVYKYEEVFQENEKIKASLLQCIYERLFMTVERRS